MVEQLENSVINLLAEYGIAASGNRDAPGVYVNGAKIAALGLRVSRGCTYHGLSFNVAMDLTPYKGIDPCGYKDLAVTDLAQHDVGDSIDTVANKLLDCLCREFRYNTVVTQNNTEWL